MPNNDEIEHYIVLALVSALTGIATKYGVDGNTLTMICSGIAAAVVAGISIYRRTNMKVVSETSTAIELPPNAAKAAATTGVVNLINGSAKVVGALLIGFLILHASVASAAPAAPKLTGDPLADLKNALTAVTATDKSTSASACDFSTFTIITPQNVVSVLQGCGQKLLTDSQAALASAVKANDSIAAACLTPGTALVQAAIGTPAVGAVAAAPATGSTPAVAASPEVAAALPGPILIFQKFREFVNNGGITNCKAWVNNTISSAAASGL